MPSLVAVPRGSRRRSQSSSGLSSSACHWTWPSQQEGSLSTYSTCEPRRAARIGKSVPFPPEIDSTGMSTHLHQDMALVEEALLTVAASRKRPHQGRSRSRAVVLQDLLWAFTGRSLCSGSPRLRGLCVGVPGPSLVHVVEATAGTGRLGAPLAGEPPLHDCHGNDTHGCADPAPAVSLLPRIQAGRSCNHPSPPDQCRSGRMAATAMPLAWILIAVGGT